MHHMRGRRRRRRSARMRPARVIISCVHTLPEELRIKYGWHEVMLREIDVPALEYSDTSHYPSNLD